VSPLNKDHGNNVSNPAFCIMPRDRSSSAQLHTVAVLEDHDGHAYTGYAVNRARGTVIVVRPDGVIGAVAFGVERTERCFDGIFKGAQITVSRNGLIIPIA
jgi:hypothetical protein